MKAWNIIIALLSLGAVVNVIVAALPKSARYLARVGPLIAAMQRAAVLVPHDADGTIQIPLLAVPLRVTLVISPSRPLASAATPVPPSGSQPPGTP